MGKSMNTQTAQPLTAEEEKRLDKLMCAKYALTKPERRQLDKLLAKWSKAREQTKH